jgi:hypothetical protein
MNESFPTAERLLQAAHRQLAGLRVRRRELMSCGIDDAHLPDERALMAFALLGDHDRGALLAELDTEWADLEARGMTNASLKASATTELRLLSSVLPVAHVVEPVRARMQRAEKLPMPPVDVWRCTHSIRGARGQIAKIAFMCREDCGLRYLWIEPDPVFGHKPKLWARPPAVGFFRLPIDDGKVRITMLCHDGRMWRHSILLSVDGGM